MGSSKLPSSGKEAYALTGFPYVGSQGANQALRRGAPKLMNTFGQQKIKIETYI